MLFVPSLPRTKKMSGLQVSLGWPTEYFSSLLAAEHEVTESTDVPRASFCTHGRFADEGWYWVLCG